MNKMVRAWLILVLSVVWLPQQAFAYSYGDPNQETIAEALKELTSKANAGDWTGVGDIYAVHRPEIESHFGAAVAGTLDADIQAQDADRFLSNYRALLALNLERRFKYANDAVEDYSQAKLLLAKAKGTYNVLQTYVKDDADDKQVLEAFDAALAALGNPGLFGVGEEPVDPATFKAKTDFILGKVKPLFPMQKAQASSSAEQPAKPAAPKPAPAAEPKPATSTQKPASKPVEQPAAVAKPAPEKATSAGEAETPTVEEAPEAEAAPESAPEAEATPEAAPVEEPAAEAAEPEAPEAETSAEPAESEPAATADAGVSADAAHAPMERQDRTNPIVSVAVIGAVAVAAAGGVLYAKKRKLF